jgi:hypothetical protein
MERFFAGYAAWSTVERISLPDVETVRHALDGCWEGLRDVAEVARVEPLIADCIDGGPVFTSHLCVFCVELDLIREGVASLQDGLVDHAVRCSTYALDYHLKVDDLSRDLAGGLPVPRQLERIEVMLREAESQGP